VESFRMTLLSLSSS